MKKINEKLIFKLKNMRVCVAPHVPRVYCRESNKKNEEYCEKLT